MNQGRGEGSGGGGVYTIRLHGNSKPLLDSFLFHFFFLHDIEICNVRCSPAEDLLPVDGVEVDDLVGLGRNDAVVERSRWRGSGV